MSQDVKGTTTGHGQICLSTKSRSLALDVHRYNCIVQRLSSRSQLVLSILSSIQHQWVGSQWFSFQPWVKAVCKAVGWKVLAASRCSSAPKTKISSVSLKKMPYLKEIDLKAPSILSLKSEVSKISMWMIPDVQYLQMIANEYVFQSILYLQIYTYMIYVYLNESKSIWFGTSHTWKLMTARGAACFLTLAQHWEMSRWSRWTRNRWTFDEHSMNIRWRFSPPRWAA